MSQSQAVDMLSNCYKPFSNINQVTLSRWENGTVTPSLPKRMAITCFMGDAMF
ncbi:hypothetical protein JCM19235_3383 [Vibrio maritimus]|uniref:HTH cro/C1-type domain-containing protein n=1 Tax=Vibrio maritimus TaxID=990268 RepID=A0A090RYK9_9VIBR|nr:hypothetical protein JCM19235_3383 [Vibrio maritimus]